MSRDDFAYALDALATAVRAPSAAPALLDSAAQAAAQVTGSGARQ